MRLFFVFFSFIISEYKTGMKKSVMKVELVKPPTTATPIGWTMPALPLEAKHIGSIPKIVVSVVIKTGRRRLEPASRQASCIFRPRSRRRFV